MTPELILMAALVGGLIACLLLIGFQLWETKRIQADMQADWEMEKRMEELAALHQPGETLAETAVRVGAQVKDSKRRARQRKAKRRQT